MKLIAAGAKTRAEAYDVMPENSKGLQLAGTKEGPGRATPRGLRREAFPARYPGNGRIDNSLTTWTLNQTATEIGFTSEPVLECDGVQ